jgi:4-amino-4-deoxy-L-arabinose transferase-like glycosyltransferase/membrane-associated phospholipid phosphatase
LTDRPDAGIDRRVIEERAGAGWSLLRRCPPALLAAALCALAAAAVLPWDGAASRALLGWQRRAPAVNELLEVLRHPGRGELTVLGVLALAGLGWRRQAWQVLAALVAVGLVVTALKHGVGRPRPIGDALSFPSGDVASAAALLVPWSFRLRRWTAIPALLVAGVAFSRMAQGAHHPSDVLAGAAVGLSAGWAATLLPWPRRARLSSLACAALAVVGSVGLALFRNREYYSLTPQFLTLATPAFAFVFVVRLLRARAARRRGPDPASWPTWALAAGIGAFLAWTTTRSTLWDIDEPLFAKSAAEMVASGNYLVPYVNGEERLAKPVLAYWLMSVPLRLAGVHDWTVRFPAVLGAMGAILLTSWIGARLFGAGAGRLAALAIATTPMLLVTGGSATTDAVLAAFISLAVAAFVADFVPGSGPPPGPGRRAATTLLLGLGIGLAVLQKGPQGLVVPLGTAGVAWILCRKEGVITAGAIGRLGVALAIAVALFLGWAIPANEATGGRFWRVGFLDNVVQRALQHRETHGGGPWYYLPVTVAAFFPWTLYLPAGIRACVLGTLGSLRARAIVAGWSIPNFVMMSLAATKLPHYVMPMFPALALLVGATAHAAHAGTADAGTRRWLRGGLWLFLPVAFGLALALIVFAVALPWTHPLPGLVAPAAGAALVLVTLGAWTTRLALRGRWRTCSTVMAVGTLALFASIPVSILPALEPFKPTAPLAAAVNARAGREIPVYTSGFREPSLDFYLGRTPVRRWDESGIPGFADPAEPAVLIATLEAVERAGTSIEELRRRGLEEIATAKGINYTIGKPVTLVALGRRLPPR